MRMQGGMMHGFMRLTAVDADTQLYHGYLLKGHWFVLNERNVVLLSDDAANATGLQAGRTLTFSHLGHRITLTVMSVSQTFCLNIPAAAAIYQHTHSSISQTAWSDGAKTP